MKSKKGVIGIQFNWVFILIAGVLILLFFGSLVFKGKEVSDLTIAETVLTNMQTIMTGAEVSVRTINPIKIPDKEIKVDCDSLSVGKISKPITKNTIVFSPESIKGRTLLAWALDWNTPYHVANFLYLTTPNIKYIFVNSNNDYAKELYDLLPNEINKQIIEPDYIEDVKDTGNYLRFVFFNNPKPDDITLSSSVEKLSNTKVSAININQDFIEFYKKTGSGFELVEKVGYLNNPMILGAMFSGNLEDYKCNLEKAFNKLNIVSQVYEKRTNSLRKLYAGTGCISYYDTSPFSIDYSKASIADIKLAIKSIETSNMYLQSSSCPTIY
jgi:hypothetical protein